MSISITSQFDAGAIEVVSAEDPAAIRLRVRPDSHAEFAQWFYFRVSGARDEPLTMSFENAADCAFADGWRELRPDQLVPRANAI
jgi:murein tripeptide amidase MpaA